MFRLAFLPAAEQLYQSNEGKICCTDVHDVGLLFMFINNKPT